MLFQLASGKAIYLTIEEFLDLTDADIQFLTNNGCGETIHNPFHGSAIRAEMSSGRENDMDYEDENPDISYDPDAISHEDFLNDLDIGDVEID